MDPSPLMDAIFKQDKAAVQQMLATGIRPDAFECAALGHAAALRDHVRHDRTLLERAGPGGFPALHLAAHYGHVACVRALLDEGTSPDLLGAAPLRNTALHAAAAGRQAAAVRALLAGGADPKLADHLGNTPLHIAAAIGDMSMIEELLSAGAARDARNAEGKTPRDIAVERGQVAAAARLA